MDNQVDHQTWLRDSAIAFLLIVAGIFVSRPLAFWSPNRRQRRPSLLLFHRRDSLRMLSGNEARILSLVGIPGIFRLRRSRWPLLATGLCNLVPPICSLRVWHRA